MRAWPSGLFLRSLLPLFAILLVTMFLDPGCSSGSLEVVVPSPADTAFVAQPGPDTSGTQGNGQPAPPADAASVAQTGPDTSGTQGNEQPAPIQGDVNGDGVLDATDQAMIAAVIEGRASYNVAADLDGNGIVDLVDMGLWLMLENASRQ